MNALFSRFKLIVIQVLLIALLCGTWGATASAQNTVAPWDYPWTSPVFCECGEVPCNCNIAEMRLVRPQTFGDIYDGIGLFALGISPLPIVGTAAGIVDTFFLTPWSYAFNMHDVPINSNPGDMTLNEGQGFRNQNGVRITNATVNDGAYLFNSDSYTEPFRIYGIPLPWTEMHRTKGFITNATVNTGGRLDNGGLIDNATVDGGFLYNSGFGWNVGGVANATLNDGMILNTGLIQTATINGGWFSNDEGSIDTANVNGGTVWNTPNASITSLNLNGGTVVNDGEIVGVFEPATVNGGWFWNRSNATISWRVDVNGGVLGNDANAHIRTLVLDAGTVHNGGRIEQLSYYDGTYNGVFQDSTGTIERLSVLGDSRGIDWGNVEELNVASSRFSGGNFFPAGIVGNFTLSSGGTVTNAGTIDNLTYTGGTYSGTGNIGTLNVGVNSGNINWGNVDTASVSGNALLNNRVNGNITIGNTLNLYGGTVNNERHISNVSYYGGTYNGSTGTIGTLNVDGYSRYIDWGNITTANVNGNGVMFNYNNATIGTANVYGDLVNADFAHIGTVNVHGGMERGSVENLVNATIGTANIYGRRSFNSEMYNSGAISMVNIYDKGTLENMSAGTITTANVHDGSITTWSNSIIDTVNVYGNGHVSNWGSGTITTANVNGGSIYNWHDAHIGSATLSNGGRLDNSNNATVGKITIDDNGWLGNSGNAVVGNLTMNGGFVDNKGEITKMTYSDGIYNGRSGGTIGELTLAGNSANNRGGIWGGDWGSVDNLQFASSGDGILSITAFVEDMPMTSASAGLQAASAELSNITFSGIDVQNSIDFSNGNIALNLFGYDAGDDSIASFFNAFGFDNGFFLDTFLGDMFGVSNVSGTEELSSFEVAFGGLDSFWIINDGDFTTDWTYNYDTGFVAYGEGKNAVPEPATLAILGLGLVGLGLARRRRKS